MKQFRSEFSINYQSYSFGYTLYAVRESDESRAQLMENGFLPYSGEHRLRENSYYLARSLRVSTSNLQLSSENRRVIQKFETFDLEWNFQKKDAYQLCKEDSLFCQRYADDRFSKSFSEKRLLEILTHDHCTHVCHITYRQKTVAILFLACETEAWHYWFAFFTTGEFMDLPLGKWCMTGFLQKANEQKIPFTYLGTCYTPSSLYKVRDYDGISYFDGNLWVNNKERLKQLCKNEQISDVTDRIKLQPEYYSNILNSE